ncbi:hypothetical protein EYF80_050932 [Liparis tanakae]|uniref:Uncharacterized protein n=1 Tax=Liparis tanakae TaxID=230148 RepID=A0A4Z2FEQ7_9TELE|nr:hypothetical protein EYF80_050932 [Liparis tanakae]
MCGGKGDTGLIEGEENSVLFDATLSVFPSFTQSNRLNFRYVHVKRSGSCLRQVIGSYLRKRKKVSISHTGTPGGTVLRADPGSCHDHRELSDDPSVVGCLHKDNDEPRGLDGELCAVGVTTTTWNSTPAAAGPNVGQEEPDEGGLKQAPWGPTE